MPITIPDSLPAASILASENVFIMPESRAIHQDIRPLKVLLLNIMPKKIETETQFLRKLSNTPLQVIVDLLRIDDHVSKNTPQAHLDRFYQSFDDVKENYYDGMIITGAPLEFIPFEEVNYWDTLVEIMNWSKSHVTSTYFSCWSVQAALKIFYDLPKQTRDVKLSGVYNIEICKEHEPLIRGFDDNFLAPHSRFADFTKEFIENNTDLEVLASSDEIGVYLAVSKDKRQVFVTGHPEYDADTLNNEYQRDLGAGLKPIIPVNYFPNNDPSKTPKCSWRSHGNLLFSNWLNYYVYQITPYNISEIRLN